MSTKDPKNHEKMADLVGERSAILSATKNDVADPSETRVDSGFRVETGRIDGESVADLRSAKFSDCVDAARAAELVECGLTTIKRNCRQGKYAGAHKATVNGQETWLIPVVSLPPAAQSVHASSAMAALAGRAAAIAPWHPAPDTQQSKTVEYRAMWEAYERSGAVHKRRAEAAKNALMAFHDLVDAGRSIGEAEKAIASSHGVSKATLWRYRQVTHGHPQNHWLPLLCPRYKGGRHPVEFTPEAYDYILGKQKNTSETSLTVVLEDARAMASSRGWVIPSYDAVADRLAKEPKWLDTVGRKGPKALERSYPTVERDYSSLALHELWESDGRRADVICVWPDGTVARPFVIIWREVRSRLVLGVKGYRNPTAEGVLAAFGMALERTGTAPKFAKLDNGREYAAKVVTGGQANRYRFKIVPGEQPGMMTHVGTIAEWSKPDRGQDKPVESFWSFVAQRCDKSAEFEGAYCGRNSVVKPENFDRKNAIPIAVYAAKLAAVLEFFNNHHRHTGSGMNGRTPMEVYREQFAVTEHRPVDPAHIRMCKLGVASIKPDKDDASYTLTIPGYGVHRYWSEKIAGLPRDVLSRKHTVYYDLENPSTPVSIYDGYGWLDDAQKFESIPFREEGGERAAAHVKAKNAYLKPKLAAVKNIKAAAQLDLPALPGVNSLTALPAPIHAVTIEDKRKPPAAAAPAYADPLTPTGNPGEFIDTLTGKVYREKTRAIPRPAPATTNADEERLAELERLTREKKRRLGRR